jgi:hypothetical protein
MASERVCASWLKPCLNCFVPDADRGTRPDLFLFSQLQAVKKFRRHRGAKQEGQARRTPNISAPPPNPRHEPILSACIISTLVWSRTVCPSSIVSTASLVLPLVARLDYIHANQHIQVSPTVGLHKHYCDRVYGKPVSGLCLSIRVTHTWRFYPVEA